MEQHQKTHPGWLGKWAQRDYTAGQAPVARVSVLIMVAIHVNERSYLHQSQHSPSVCTQQENSNSGQRGNWMHSYPKFSEASDDQEIHCKLFEIVVTSKIYSGDRTALWQQLLQLQCCVLGFCWNVLGAGLVWEQSHWLLAWQSSPQVS